MVDMLSPIKIPIFEFQLKNIKYTFAIECKWRQNYYKSGINWAKKIQVERYNNYASDRNIPIFIIIGVNGTPDNPNEIFIVPLKAMKFGFVKTEYLKKFNKE